MPDKIGYTRALLENARRFKAMDRATIQKMLALLRDAQREIAGRLMAGSDWQVYALRELTRSIERSVGDLERALVDLSVNSVLNAYELGGQAAMDPMRALGYQVQFYRPSQSQVNILTDFSADLIKGATAETVAKINVAIRAGVLGGRSQGEVMDAIGKILGMKGGRMLSSGYSVRAERIFRTETMRVFNLASQAQSEAMKGMIPELLKRWVATGDSRTRADHLQAHQRYSDNPIPVDEPFIVGGEELMYPLDPAGSPENTINCRCRSVNVHPEVGVIGTPLDSAVTREIGRRNEREE